MSLLICGACGQYFYEAAPDKCRLCRAPRDRFIPPEEADRRFRVVSTPVADRVSRLHSEPSLGSWCFRVETDQGPVWVDCPCAFDTTLEPVDAIFFTHKDFLGASRRYREHWGAEVCIHELEVTPPFARGYEFDRLHSGDFRRGSLEGYHIGGHGPGFTMYLHENVIFVCDIVLVEDDGHRLTPYGMGKRALKAAVERILEVTSGRDIEWVCGWNSVTPFSRWKPALERALQEL